MIYGISYTVYVRMYLNVPVYVRQTRNSLWYFQFPDQSASYPTLGQRLLLYRHDPHCENILQLIRSPRQICHGDVIEIVLSGKIFHFSFIICFIYQSQSFNRMPITVFYSIKYTFGAPYNILHIFHLPDSLTISMRWSLHSRSIH